MTYTVLSTVHLLSALEHNICQMSHVLADAEFICHEFAVLWGKIRRTYVTTISSTLIQPKIMLEFGITHSKHYHLHDNTAMLH